MRYERELEMCVETMKKMHRRGIRVCIGGDYGFAWTPQGTNAKDIQTFVEMLGFSPMEAILAATKYGGEIMGMGNELGHDQGRLSGRSSAGRRRSGRQRPHPAGQVPHSRHHEGRQIPQGAEDERAAPANDGMSAIRSNPGAGLDRRGRSDRSFGASLASRRGRFGLFFARLA